MVIALAVGLAISGTFTLASPAIAAEPTAKRGKDHWTAITPTERNPRGWKVAVDKEALRIAGEGKGDCSAWRSTTIAPPTIRVWRQAYGPAEGTVQVVPMRQWAEQVLRTQMPAYYPMEALKANAIFVKQYGWYYTINWRGGFAPDGNCYDVRDATDGFYRPEVYTPAPQHIAAQEATWPFSLRKFDTQTGASRMFLTGYRAGATVPCGTDSDGWHLMQHGAFDCGKIGHTWEGVMRNYVEPRLEIVDPGAHNLLGDIRGDAGVLDTSGEYDIVGRAYRASAGGFGAPLAPTITIEKAGFRSTATADATGDRLEDLIVFADGANGPELRVHRANGTGYEPAKVFWTDTNGKTNAATRLISEDFDADGRADAGLLVPPAEAGGLTKLLVLTSKVTFFNQPLTWWKGVLDLDPIAVHAADADGDGRSDVILERTIDGGGMEYLVLKSQLKGGLLVGPTSWLTRPSATRANTKTTVGNSNRDGRDDVLIVTPTATGSRITVLRSTGLDTFAAKVLWTSPASAPLSYADLKVGGGDFNFDGRGDVLLLVDRGAGNGTRFMVYLPNDTTGTMGTWRNDGALDWQDARIY